MKRSSSNILTFASLVCFVATAILMLGGSFNETWRRDGRHRFSIEINRSQIICEECVQTITPPISSPLLQSPGLGVRAANEMDQCFAADPVWKFVSDPSDRPSADLSRFGEIMQGFARPRSYFTSHAATGFSIGEEWTIKRYSFWTVPLWLPLAMFSILPLLWLWRCVRRKFPPAAMIGMCPICGYDLRASPLRCPECGNATVIS